MLTRTAVGFASQIATAPDTSAKARDQGGSRPARRGRNLMDHVPYGVKFKTDSPYTFNQYRKDYEQAISTAPPGSAKRVPPPAVHSLTDTRHTPAAAAPGPGVAPGPGIADGTNARIIPSNSMVMLFRPSRLACLFKAGGISSVHTQHGPIIR